MTPESIRQWSIWLVTALPPLYVIITKSTVEVQICSVAPERALPWRVCGDPDIGSKIRRRHRVGRGLIGVIRSGGTFSLEIGEIHRKEPYFVSGRGGVFSPWAANTGVQGMVKTVETTKIMETCQIEIEKVGMKWNLEF